MITCKKKMNTKAVIVGSAIFFFSGICVTAEALAIGIWISDANVSELGTSQHSAEHRVWLSGGSGMNACQFALDLDLLPSVDLDLRPIILPLLFFDDQPGGKSMMATLTTALVANRKVDVLADGCNIVEVHLK